MSIPLDMMEEVQRQLQTRGGNFSAYIQELIAQDLSRAMITPDSSDQEALVLLAERFHPTATTEIRHWAHGNPTVQQPFFIYSMLCALHNAIVNKSSRITLELPANPNQP